MAIEIGSLLGDRYTIERELGAGGMGMVFAARDRVLERPVAIKILRPEYRAHPLLTARFHNEARIVAGLFANPNIVNIYDLGRTADNDLFLVMELMTGRSLRDCIDPDPTSWLSRSFVIEVGYQIAWALHEAHAAHVTHRDLKPENVFVLESHMLIVKVLDFGIAASPTSSLSPEFKTQPGQILGTVQYLSPEGAAGTDVGPPGDIYALGLVLYEMAAGTSPYDATSFGQWIRAHELDPPNALPSAAAARYPQRFADLIWKTLAKKPSARPTALEVYKELRSISDDIEASR